MNKVNNNMEAGTVYHIAAGGTSQQVYICNDTQGGFTVHTGYAHQPEFPSFEGFGVIGSTNAVHYGEGIDIPCADQSVCDADCTRSGDKDGCSYPAVGKDLITYIREHAGLVTLQDFNVQDEDYSLVCKMYSELIEKVKAGYFEV